MSQAVASETIVSSSRFEINEDDKPVPMGNKQFYATFLEFIDTQLSSSEIYKTQSET
jgi:hypothetical protein